jgi:hypothetical protein
MALILNGTDGLSDVDGTAATPAIRGTDTNTGIFFPAADTIAFSEGGTEAMRIDSSGNVGIGTSSPVQRLQATGADGTGFVGIRAQNNNSNIGLAGVEFSSDSTYAKAAIAQLRQAPNGVGPLVFYVDSNTDAANWGTGDEKMRINQSGNALIGTTTQYSGAQLTVAGAFSAAGIYTKAGSGVPGDAANVFNINWTGNAGVWIDSTFIGNIAYQSDYRIKRNIETQTAPAIERVMALRPVTYQMADYGNLFKAGDDIKEGFIAHEVQEVIPSGAEGAKDEENRIQNLRLDAILAVAVKAIQELKATVDAQAARIAALEAAV